VVRAGTRKNKLGGVVRFVTKIEGEEKSMSAYGRSGKLHPICGAEANRSKIEKGGTQEG